jgi:hypothetical protein
VSLESFYTLSEIETTASSPELEKQLFRPMGYDIDPDPADILDTAKEDQGLRLDYQ